MDETTKKQLLTLARRAVEAAVKGEPAPSLPADLPLLREKCGAFVTLKKHGELRGCIGCPEPVKELGDAIRDSARSAALHDPRFPAVRPGELPELEIELSVLTPPEPVADIKDIEVGTHGLIIRKGFQSGLLLPQVATEWGWDRQTFLEYTCRKAGLPPDAWQRGAEILSFSAEVFGEGETTGACGG